MLAIAHAGAFPSVDEYAVDAVARHDLAFYLCHEFEVVRPKTTSDPHFRRCPMPASFAGGVDGDPVRMRGFDVVVGCVRISAHDDHHAQFAATGDKFAEDV